MPSKVNFLFGVPMFVGCCAILWNYWGRFKKAPKKKIFISADCWLCVFDLLPLSQLGLGIAQISHRFDFYVDEHFKTRKWTLGKIQIGRKIGKNGTKEMEMANSDGKQLPTAQIQMPRKIIGFRSIAISFIDQNVIAFLHRFTPLFASFCPINLIIDATSDRILVFILRNIWPMIVKNIDVLQLSAGIFHRLRQFVPSFLTDCPSLRVDPSNYDGFFAEFPANDSAMASDGQAVGKWLFTPLQNDVPKVFKCWLHCDRGHLASGIEAFKAAFASASSPVNFIFVIRFPPSFAKSVVPFSLINELTREQLVLKKTSDGRLFVFIRCPISRDESKWTKWEKEAIGLGFVDQWNRIDIHINNEDEIGDGLLDAGPSDQQ